MFLDPGNPGNPSFRSTINQLISEQVQTWKPIWAPTEVDPSDLAIHFRHLRKHVMEFGTVDFHLNDFERGCKGYRKDTLGIDKF